MSLCLLPICEVFTQINARVTSVHPVKHGTSFTWHSLCWVMYVMHVGVGVCGGEGGWLGLLVCIGKRECSFE